jgi:hypothetical protein
MLFFSTCKGCSLVAAIAGMGVTFFTTPNRGKSGVGCNVSRFQEVQTGGDLPENANGEKNLSYFLT